MSRLYHSIVALEQEEKEVEEEEEEEEEDQEREEQGDTVLNIFIINPVVRRAHDLVSNSRFVSPFHHGRDVNIVDSINRKDSLA